MLPLLCLGGYRPHLSVVVASVKMDLCTALPMSAQSHGQTIFFTRHRRRIASRIAVALCEGAQVKILLARVNRCAVSRLESVSQGQRLSMIRN